MNTIGILGGFVGPHWMGFARDLTGNYQRGLLTMTASGCCRSRRRHHALPAQPYFE